MWRRRCHTGRSTECRELVRASHCLSSLVSYAYTYIRHYLLVSVLTCQEFVSWIFHRHLEIQYLALIPLNLLSIHLTDVFLHINTLLNHSSRHSFSHSFIHPLISLIPLFTLPLLPLSPSLTLPRPQPLSLLLLQLIRLPPPIGRAHQAKRPQQDAKSANARSEQLPRDPEHRGAPGRDELQPLLDLVVVLLAADEEAGPRLRRGVVVVVIVVVVVAVVVISATTTTAAVVGGSNGSTRVVVLVHRQRRELQHR